MTGRKHKYHAIVTLYRINQVIGCHLLTDPAASMQAALESHSWTRQPQFSLFSWSQTGPHAAGGHQPGLLHCHHCCRGFTLVVAATAKKGYSSLGVKCQQTSPVFSTFSLQTCKPFPAEGPRKPLTSFTVNSIVTDTPRR